MTLHSFDSDFKFYFILFITVCFLFCISGCSRTAEAPVSTREILSEDNQTGTKIKKPVQQEKKSIKPQQPKPITKSGVYIVKDGDTLYSIAWRYGLDFRDVAEWNGINEPYIIYPGQEIQLKGSGTKPKTAKLPNKSLQPGPVVSEDYKQQQKQQKDSELQPKPVTKSAETTKTVAKKVKPVEVASKPSKKKIKKPLPSGKIIWQWPTKGKLVKLNQPISKKGVDISGRLGQAIKSSAAGRVVYSGSGLLGYGRLIIVKHSETYLSAYAHNSELLVREGDDVAVGQTIAKMGKNSGGQALLHFEIRKNGKSVNPLRYLPKQ